jgi:Ser/Thr protein kinase RdoA (MazF antagonist)
LSKIHGDLHLGNIIVGPNNSASLIDFAHTRDGHTLFDWATLEVSLLSDLVAPVAGEGWDGARLALRYMDALNTHRTLPADHPELTTSFAAVTSLRRIVGECLATENVWSEYFIALALCALRAIMWETMPVGSRRLMLLIAAQSIGELRNHPQAMLSQEVTSPDDTDHSNPASDQ